MAAFKKGDRVAWHHTFASQHAEGSIIKTDAAPPDADVGKVVRVANDEGTWFEVDFGKDGKKVLTEDELVRVADK